MASARGIAELKAGTGSTDSLLLVLPAGSGSSGQPSPDTVIAGLPLLRRIVLAGSRAGLQPVLVEGPGSDSDGLLAGTGALRVSAVEAIPSTSQKRIVLCPANVLPQPQWLRSLVDAPIEPDTLYVDASMVAVVETAEPGKVLSTAACCGSVLEFVAALGETLRRAPGFFDPRGRFQLTRSEDVRRAEAWLLRSLIKPSEGFMSRHVERRLSLALTRRLVATGITPNAMTLVSVAVGLMGAPFFLSAQPAYQITGALLFVAHSILDGCDGELARLKFLESRHGAILDFWGDNLVHTAVVACMAAGWALGSETAWPLVLGGAAIGSMLATAAALSRHWLGPSRSGASGGPMARLGEALAHRDFIYLVLLLSALGKAWWFLPLAAAGTPIFVLLFVRAGRGGWRS